MDERWGEYVTQATLAQAACDAWVIETAIERGLLSEEDAIALQMEWAWVDRTEAV